MDTRSVMLIAAASALAGGGVATLASGGRAGPPVCLTAPEPAEAGTPGPDLAAVTVEDRGDGPVVVAPLTRTVTTSVGGAAPVVATVPAGERVHTPQYVADALAACARYAVERGVAAPRLAEWEAYAAALRRAGVGIPPPTEPDDQP